MMAGLSESAADSTERRGEGEQGYGLSDQQAAVLKSQIVNG